MRTELLSLIAKKMNVNGLKSALLVTILLMFGGVSFAQPWTEDFDDQTNGSYLSSFTCSISGTWTASQAGNFSLGTAQSGTKCVAINDNKSGAHITTPNLNTCGTVSFYYYARSGSATDQFELQVSENGGAFSTVETFVYGGTTDPPYGFYSFDVNSSESQVNIRVLNDNQDSHLIIDDFSVTAYSVSTCSGEPTAQATGITVSNETENSIDVSWTAGTGGDNYILVAREGSSVSWTPTDGTNYFAQTGSGDFSSATDQASGNKVVYVGTGTSTTVTGLSASTTYYFQVFHLCSSDSDNYLTSIGTNNDGTQNGTTTAVSTSKKILFDGTSGQSDASADWVVDADSWDLDWYSSGTCHTTGTESNPQRYPTPAAPTAESDWVGGNSKWAYELYLLGYTIESLGGCQDITYGDGGNPQDLSNYDVFICNEPNVQFTASEKTAIIAFVNAGGGLYMGADHGDPSAEVCGGNTEADRNCDGWNSTEIWNDLMSGDPFGIQFNHDNTASPTSSNVNADASDPLLHGIAGDVTSMSFNQGATMDINTTNNSTAKGAVFMTGEPLSSTTNIMVAYSEYGAGRVVGVGDSSPTGDATGDTDGETRFDNWSDNDNGTIIMNATIWLLGPTGPEINVKGNSVNIVDGDITPSVTDDTDFGSVLASSGTIVKTFTIENVGTSDLTISNATVSAGDFTITTAPAGTVAASGSTTIVITYDPGAVGTTTETVTITSDDVDEGTYTFDITGEGLAPDATAPLVTTLSPLDNATDVAINADLVLTFDETVQAGTGNILIKEVSGGATFQTIAIGSAIISGSTVTISHNDFANSTAYYVEIASGVIKDNATTPNNYAGLSGSSAWNFTTEAVAAGGCASDLIISEYCEGSIGSNKYIEIYNGTGASVDLSDYEIYLYSNGSATASQTESLSGTLANESVYVIGGSDLYTPDITSNVSFFNGDDAIALYKISTTSFVDIFGEIGDDPGSAWTSGSFSTANKTLVRNSDVTSGITTNPTGFPTLSTEWTQYDADNFSYLGAHTMTCVTEPEINIQENSTDYLSGSTYDFGEVENGSSSAVKTFTIQNTGTSALAISGTPKVAISGANAAEYTIDQTSTSASIAASGTTTFTITFNPSSVAVGKTAQISIANDDSDENPYIINLTGDGTAPDVTAPTVNTYSPVDEATGVSISTDLILTFDENVQKGTGNIYIKLVSDNTTVQTIDVTNAAVTVSGTSVTINPPSDLATLTAYYITIDSGAIEDMANNDYTGISAATTWNFTTADVVSTTTCIDEDFESGLSGSYVTGSISLSDGLWLAENAGYKSTTNNLGVAACQIQNTGGAFIATPILYNVQTVTFWFYDGDIPIVKYGTALQTVNTVTDNGAGQFSEYSVTINATTSERVYFYSDGFTGYLDNVSTICEVEPCIPAVITSQPSTTAQLVCKSTAPTDLSITADGTATAYQWYSNTTASNSGGTLLSGATNSTYTPVTSSAGTLYYYCVVTSSPSTCTATSDVSGAVVVKANPYITPDLTVCSGATLDIDVDDDVTNPPAASNPWVSASTGVATIDDSGVATGVSAGTSDITYTDSDGCIYVKELTVEPGTPTISGTANVCIGLTTALTGTPTGGTWSSGNTSLATVNSSTGVVTGVATGSPVITYTTGCGSDDQSVTVNALPTISGTLSVCGGSNTTLTGSPAGGSWSSASTGVATIDAGTGVVTGVSTGTSVITYTATTGCEETSTVSVSAPTISGTTAVNIGGNVTLTGAPAGGTWSSATPANVTINSSTGVVTGVASGTSLITYSVAGCDATTTVTSSAGPCLGMEEFDGGLTPPAGWTFTDITGTYNSVQVGISGPAVKFEDNDQVIETPSFTNATELSFYCNTNWPGSTSRLLIEGWDGSSWLTIDDILVPETDATGDITYNGSSTPALTTGFTKFKFTFTKNIGNAGFDDVIVYCSPDFKEIGLEANGNAIVDGDNTPQAADFTDFGSVAVSGGTAERTFTINNFGTQDLNLTGSPIVETTGDFSVVSQPSSSAIAGGSSLTFTVQFDPTVVGECLGTISIANDDPNENPYNFSIKGEGLASASPWAIDEKFDGVSSMATITNTNTPGFTATGTGSISAATGAAQFNRSVNALTFLGSAGSTVTITTPTFSNADILSFWYKQPNETSSNPFLIEQYSPTKAGWTTLATIPGGAGSIKGRVYFYSLDPTTTQVRFTYTRTSTSYQGYFDDVRIRKSGACSDNVKILQTLVQSCMGNEGINEAVIIKTGTNAINVDDLSISFPNVGVGGTEYSMEADQTFTTNATYVNDLNSLVQVSDPTCSPLLSPPSGIIPADSYAIIFAGADPSVDYDLQSACASGTNYYAVFCDNVNTVGRYGNNPSVGEDNYTTIIDKASGCYDTQFYDEGIPNTAGALALYDETTGVRTYDNYGCEIVLPVELISFTGICTEHGIEFNWETASEANNDYFTIEKSHDLQSWEQIAFVQGAGNSHNIIEYVFLYEEVPEKMYYRLKQTDFNGESVYLETIFISCESGNESLTALYPNPVNSILNVDIYSVAEAELSIQIVNAFGQNVKQFSKAPIKGMNTFSLNINHLPDGLYYLVLYNSLGKTIGREKFVVQSGN